MFDLQTMLVGLSDAFTLSNLFYVVSGVIVGQIVGAIPGLSILMALAIGVPFTYTLDPLAAVSFLISINKGGTVGGAVPAILLNTPGTPESAATTLDGHPMAQKGRPVKAMKYALYYSVFGDTSSDLVLILVSAPLAVVALMMGPIEVTALIVLSFTVIGGLVGPSMTKGLIAAALGFLVASVGLDPAFGTVRFSFGLLDLYDGVPLAALTIGMLAVGEIFVRIAGIDTQRPVGAAISTKSKSKIDQAVTLKELLANRAVAFRGFLIGTGIGALPGLGSVTAGFLSYSIAKQSAKDPESFGKGDPRGIAASEAANSAVVGANLIPLLTLGIPGNISAALLVAALVLQGIQPGPLLFEQNGRLVYGMFGAMLIANLANLVVGQFAMRLWAFVVSAPSSVIYPGALLLCIVGSYASSGFFGILVMIGAAMLSYAMTLFGYSIVTFLIAFVLTPKLEQSIYQSILISNGDPSALLYHPVAILLLLLSAAIVVRFAKRQNIAIKE